MVAIGFGLAGSVVNFGVVEIVIVGAAFEDAEGEEVVFE